MKHEYNRIKAAKKRKIKKHLQLKRVKQKERINKCSNLIHKRKKSSLSVGENLIAKFLAANEISFSREHYFSNLFNNKTDHLLFFDFYLPEYNMAIEFDGIHHFKPIYGIEVFEAQKHKDIRKNKFCQKHNIKLLRIKCFDVNNTEEIICSFIDRHYPLSGI